jgi:hypothetical protein
VSSRDLSLTKIGIIDMSGWHSMNRAGLATISFAVALVCIGLLALLVRDRWNRPEVKPPEQARHATTGQAAGSAGAQVLRTDPKLAVEPTPVGPKPAQPANPD